MDNPPTKEDHPYILRNCIAVHHCAVLAFQEIIGLKWINSSNDTLEEYFDSVGISNFFKNQTAERRWRDKNQRKLQERSCETFDVTFLNEILPMICSDKVAKAGSAEQERRLNDPNSVEWHLKEIKNRRNDVSHEAEKLRDRNFITNLKDMTRSCLIAACNLYGITSQVEIDQMTSRADGKFESIIRDITSDRQSRVILLKHLILSDCIDKMKDRVTNMKISLPGNSKIEVDISKVFKNIYLRDSNDNFECRTLLTKVTKKVNILMGRSGSGKTTLLKIVQKAVILGEQSDFESSDRYSLALPISCQTNNETHLGNYFKALLPDIFATFDKDEVLDSLRLIDGVLFLIDGYDEANEKSRELTNSAIEFCNNSGINASCIISSRIKAANGFAKHLATRGLDHHVITIDKIEDQNAQTELIRSYGEQLLDVNEEEAVDKFNTLNQKVRSVFSNPLLLSHYCMLYKSLANESEKIKEVDVFRGISRQIQDGLSVKLQNVDDSSSTIMDIIGKHCLHLIGLDKTVFSEEEYDNLKASCKSASPSVGNMDNLLENVLLPKIPDNIYHETTYSFIHFSIHEYLASETIKKKLKDFPGVISREEFIKMLDLSPLQMEKNIGRYQNVFRFLILSLHSTGEIATISSAMSEIMAKDVQPDYQFCIELICDTEDDDGIIKMMAAAIASHSSFIVEGVSQGKSLVKALYHDQNNAKKRTNDLSIGQKKSLALNMRKSHDEYEVVDDDFFEKLEKIKCSITLFRGCLATDFSLGVLASKLASNCQLYISCPSAISHKMKILEGKTNHFIEFTFKYCDNFTPGGHNSLPRSRNGLPPVLRITDTPGSCQDNVYNMICGLAPTNSAENSHTFTGLYLPRCSLSASEANKLVQKLSDKDFTTHNEGVTRAVELSRGRNEYCYACRANHNDEKITCYDLELSKSDYLRHLDSICTANFSETAIKQVEPALKEVTAFKVGNTDHLSALIKVLTHSQQSSAHSSGVDGHETKSVEKAGKTKQIEIQLLDSYRNFKPLSDGIFQDLQSVRCNIVKFVGCIDSACSLNVLKSKLTKRSKVTISSSVTNHHLNILNGVETKYVMHFMFKYEGESLGENSYELPRLSDGCPPVLRVTDAPDVSVETICSFISSLAPVKSTTFPFTFVRLFLARCSLTAVEANKLAEKLSAKNYTTDDEGVTRATKLSSARNEYCEACHDRHEEDNLICYQLQLPRKYDDLLLQLMSALLNLTSTSEDKAQSSKDDNLARTSEDKAQSSKDDNLASTSEDKTQSSKDDNLASTSEDKAQSSKDDNLASTSEDKAQSSKDDNLASTSEDKTQSSKDDNLQSPSDDEDWITTDDEDWITADDEDWITADDEDWITADDEA